MKAGDRVPISDDAMAALNEAFAVARQAQQSARALLAGVAMQAGMPPSDVYQIRVDAKSQELVADPVPELDGEVLPMAAMNGTHPVATA